MAAFLQAHLDQMRATSPPGSVHALDLDGLRAPGTRFWSAYDGGELVGCAALALVDPEREPGHGELKSMRTAPHRVREGIAGRLLVHVLAEARAAGLTRVSLETGSQDFFAPARALYARHGFVACPPFGDYRPDPHSTFLTRPL
ncbi:GNAT family N-acetyltransferase [Nocardioides dongkuii]|uniref:GNAT family N-acetyltransferase n=1 Tax=Nocardioides dongkuii TaxID=2760089 RepID=UPI001FD16D1F|nr:GNAT family N-acetyltransferase [Nocardioides dongkuii]